MNSEYALRDFLTVLGIVAVAALFSGLAGLWGWLRRRRYYRPDPARPPDHLRLALAILGATALVVGLLVAYMRIFGVS